MFFKSQILMSEVRFPLCTIMTRSENENCAQQPETREAWTIQMTDWASTALKYAWPPRVWLS